MTKKPDGKVVAEIGEQRKRKFKSFLASHGLTFKEWLISTIDLVIKREGKE